MKNKKVLCLLLCLLFVLSAFVGCIKMDVEDGEETDSASEVLDTSEDSKSNDTPEGEFLVIVRNGVAVDVIYSQNAIALTAYICCC